MRKPRIAFLADRRNWAYSKVADALTRTLRGSFSCRTYYADENPRIKDEDCDLLYVFFWGEDRWKRLDINPFKVIREVSSFRWRDQERWGNLSSEEFVRQFLSDGISVTTTNLGLYRELVELRDDVHYLPNGIDTARYHPRAGRHGELAVGWCGNPADASKGLADILLPAIDGIHGFEATSGLLRESQVADFYRSKDVLAIASCSEGQPLPLMEAMACGCFPVATDVGIVGELITHGENGLIVERTPEAFRDAFAWCAANLEHVRSKGQQNARMMRQQRDWTALAPSISATFEKLHRRSMQRELTTVSSRGSQKLTPPPDPSPDIFQAAYEEHLTGIQTSGGNALLDAPSFPEDLSNHIPIYANADILEIGTGHGALVGSLVKRGHTRVVALDLSRKLLESVQNKYGKELRGAYWGNAKDFLELNPESFDLIVMFDVLEHFDERELSPLLKSLRKSLRKGGRLVVRTPNMAVPLGVFSRYIDFTHKTAFTEFSLQQVLEAHGFRQVRHLPQGRSARFIHRVVFAIYRRLLRAWYRMENRTVPDCLQKNLLTTCVN